MGSYIDLLTSTKGIVKIAMKNVCNYSKILGRIKSARAAVEFFFRSEASFIVTDVRNFLKEKRNEIITISYCMAIAIMLLCVLSHAKQIESKHIDTHHSMMAEYVSMPVDRKITEKVIEHIHMTNFEFVRSYEREDRAVYEITMGDVDDVRSAINRLSTDIYLIWHAHGYSPVIVIKVLDRYNQELCLYSSINGVL